MSAVASQALPESYHWRRGFKAVTSILAAVAFAACWVPARRASRVDPVRALQWE